MKKLSSVFVVVFALLCGCTRAVMNELDDVASYIQTRPDSALNVLKGIDTLSLRGSAEKAKYSLLYAMAIDKNYIDTTDAGVIMPAVDYYEKRGTDLEKAQSLYYLGRIQQNGADYAAACITLKRAYRCSEAINDCYWKAMSAAALSLSHNGNHNNDDELKWAIIAYDNFRENGDSSHIDLALFHLGYAYHNNRYFEKADSLFEYLCSKDHPFYAAYVGRAINEATQDCPRGENVASWYSSALSEGISMSLYDYYNYAYALLLAGDKEKAYSLKQQLSKYPDDAQTYYSKYRWYKALNDTEEALYEHERYASAVDSTVRSLLNQSVYRAESDYYRHETEKANYERKMSLMELLLGIMLSLILITAVTIVAVLRVRASKAEKEVLQNDLEQTMIMMEMAKENESSVQEKYNNIRKAFAQIFHSQFEEVNRLLGYKKKVDNISKATMQKYADKIAEIVSEVRNEDKQYKFEERLNAECDNIMKKLREDFPMIGEENFRLLSYLIVGLDSSAIAFLCNVSRENARVKKTRIKGIVLNAETPNHDLYYTFLKSQNDSH